MLISPNRSMETSYAFLSGPPVPLKYTFVGSTLMTGSLQSSKLMVRETRFFLCAHMAGGGSNLVGTIEKVRK